MQAKTPTFVSTEIDRLSEVTDGRPWESATNSVDGHTELAVFVPSSSSSYLCVCTTAMRLVRASVDDNMIIMINIDWLDCCFLTIAIGPYPSTAQELFPACCFVNFGFDNETNITSLSWLILVRTDDPPPYSRHFWKSVECSVWACDTNPQLFEEY